MCGGEEEDVALLMASVRRWQNSAAAAGLSLNGLIHGQAALASPWAGYRCWADRGYQAPF